MGEPIGPGSFHHPARPAMALGIIEWGLSLAEIFSYPHAFGIKRNQYQFLLLAL
jgi:hypothetical protein